MLQWLFRAANSSALSKFQGVPGPAPSFPLGTALDFLGKRWPWEVCADYARQYGGLSLTWFFGKPTLVLNDPALIEEVLVTNWKDYYKRDPVAALKPVITEKSLFISNVKDGWEQARTENPFSTTNLDEWLNRQVEPLKTVFSTRLKSWVEQSQNTTVDLYLEMQRLMFDAFAVAFWGQVLPPNYFDWFQALAREGTRRMGRPVQMFPAWLPSFLDAKHNWYSGFTNLVRRARTKPDPQGVDLLNTTLAQGSKLSDESLAEALATNFFGGVFSCSSTVNTALALLTRHPSEMSQLQATVQGEFRGIAFDRAKLDSCRPLEFAIRESMRYYPAVPLYFRNSAVDREVKLGSLALPPDTTLIIANWYLPKSSPHWGDPEIFRPARWENGVAEANPYGSGYFYPFGRGPRSCIGSQFARLVNKLCLATFLCESHLTLNSEEPYRQSFFFGVMMPKGLQGRFNAS